MDNRLIFYGKRSLRQVSERIGNINQDIIDLIDTMFNLMYKNKGIGLAAPQIDISKRIITLDIEMYDGPSLALINPEIIARADDSEPYEEGCLSLPGISCEIYRPSRISVKGITPDEKEVKIEADGLLARVLQHEIDHLNGVLFIDYLEDYRRKEITAELKRIKKLNRVS